MSGNMTPSVWMASKPVEVTATVLVDSPDWEHHLLEDGKLAIDSINHHPFTQQTEELKEGFKVARWSYNPTEKTIAFWKAA